MKGFILNGAMYRVFAIGDVLQAYYVFGNWGSMYTIWESTKGWCAAIKITGAWNKLRGESYKTEQQAFDDAIEHNNTSANGYAYSLKFIWLNQ